MDSSFESLVHITPWTKAVAFITSQLDGGELFGEFFLLLIDDQGQLRQKNVGVPYPPEALKLLCPDGSYVKYGLEDMRSRVTNELAVILTELFCRKTPSGDFDPRCRFAIQMPTLHSASMATLASILPEEKELHRVYQTRNAQLRQFLSGVFLVKKVVRPYPIE